MITYLIHSSILLAGFSLFYWLVLRQETFFRLNRATLLVGIGLSLTVPLIKVPSSMSILKTQVAPVAMIEDFVKPVTAPPTSILNAREDAVASDTPPITRKSFLSLQTLLNVVYGIGSLIFLAVFLMQVIALHLRRRNFKSFKTGRYTIVETEGDTEPYSFLNTIYVNPANYDRATYHHIIEHEKIHINQSHFVDKLLAEMLVIVFWFNPFVWMLRSMISKNLEFLTDQTLLNQGVEKKNYQMSLLKVSVSNQPFNLTMSYNSSFLKNRIKMMNSKKSSVATSWKYLFILPLFALSMLSLNAIEEKAVQPATPYSGGEIVAPTTEFGDKGLVKKFTINGAGSVDVSTSGGHIHVVGHSGNEATVTVNMHRDGRDIEAGSREWDEAIKEYDLEVALRGNNLVASAKRKSSNKGWNSNTASISFELEIPTDMAGDLSTSGGHIHVENLSGDQKMKTSGGHLEILGISGRVNASTSGGHIKLKDQSGDADVRTSGGMISVSNASGDLLAKTSGGSISLAGINGDVDAQTSGGTIDIRGSAPKIKAITSGGNVSVNLDKVTESIYLKTSGGSIDAQLSSHNNLDLDLKGSKVDVDNLGSFSGSHEKDRVTGKSGNGAIPVYMHTSNGRVSLRFG